MRVPGGVELDGSHPGGRRKEEGLTGVPAILSLPSPNFTAPEIEGQAASSLAGVFFAGQKFGPFGPDLKSQAAANGVGGGGRGSGQIRSS